MTAITGVMPVAPTIFTEDEALDLDGQRRVLDYLVDGQADAVCVLANYSEQFSLTDGEREQVLRATLEHAAGRLPVCVTTSPPSFLGCVFVGVGSSSASGPSKYSR